MFFCAGGAHCENIEKLLKDLDFKLEKTIGKDRRKALNIINKEPKRKQIRTNRLGSLEEAEKLLLKMKLRIDIDDLFEGVTFPEIKEEKEIEGEEEIEEEGEGEDEKSNNSKSEKKQTTSRWSTPKKLGFALAGATTFGIACYIGYKVWNAWSKK